MRRSHVLALLCGLGVGIGIGVVALFLVMNRVQMVGVQMMVSPPAAPIAAVKPVPLPVAAAKPVVRAKPRKLTAATATADTRRTPPTIQYPAYSGTAPIGSGGTIFSGADANDPRVQHFAD